jgi:hypothetical protein
MSKECPFYEEIKLRKKREVKARGLLNTESAKLGKRRLYSLQPSAGAVTDVVRGRIRHVKVC